MLNNAEAEILFVGAEFYEIIEELLPKLAAVRKVIAVDGKHKNWEDYSSWRDSQQNHDPKISISADNDVVQLYTSGTTGHPKGCLLYTSDAADE